MGGRGGDVAAMEKPTGNKMSRALLPDVPIAGALPHANRRHSFKRIDVCRICSLDVNESSAN